MNRFFALAACAALGWSGAVLAQGAKPDMAKAEATAKQVCAACHSADGNSPAPANPKIAGQMMP